MAHQPSRFAGTLTSAWVEGSPTTWAAPTIPKPSSSSCRLPATSRLAPVIISAADSSTTAIVSAAPGRKVTSGAIIARRSASAQPCPASTKLIAATAKAAATGRIIWTLVQWPPTSLNAPTRAPNSPARTRSPQVGWRMRQIPTVSTTWPRIVTPGPKRGRMSTIFRIRRLPSSGDGSPRSAALSTSNSAAVWSSRAPPAAGGSAPASPDAPATAPPPDRSAGR